MTKTRRTRVVTRFVQTFKVHARAERLDKVADRAKNACVGVTGARGDDAVAGASGPNRRRVARARDGKVCFSGDISRNNIDGILVAARKGRICAEQAEKCVVNEARARRRQIQRQRTL